MSIKINRIIQSDAVTASSLVESFAEIRRLAKNATAKNRLRLELVLDADIYRLTEPLKLSTEDEPALAYVDLTIRSKVDGVRSTISGARAIPGRNFVKVEGKPYYKYQFDADEKGEYPKFRELLVNGAHIPMARGEHLYRGEQMFYPFDCPVDDRKKHPDAVHRGAYLPVQALKRLTAEDISGAECQFYHGVHWNIFRMKDVDFTDTREQGGETYALVTFQDEDADFFINKLSGPLPLSGSAFHFVNAPAYLAPGTFTYDYFNGTLLYYPLRESDLKLPIEYPVAERLLEFHGMENLTVDRVRFTGATSRFACEHFYRAYQAYGVINGVEHPTFTDQAAVYATETRRFTVKNCVFEQLGGHGLRLADHHAAVRIHDCIFKNISMSGIFIGNLHSDFENPKNRLYDVRIHNNYLEHICCEYPIGGAVTVAKVDGLSICHNTVREVGYAAIHVGWHRRFQHFCPGEEFNIRDAEIAYNYIDDYVLASEDGGAVCVLAGNAGEEYAKRFNVMHHNYATAKEMLARGREAYCMDSAASNWDCHHNVSFGANFFVYAQPDPCAYNHHNHIYDNYGDSPIPHDCLAPERDVLAYDNVLEALPEEEFLAKHEEARRIRDAAGCSPEFLVAAVGLHGDDICAGKKYPMFTRIPTGERD